MLALWLQLQCRSRHADKDWPKIYAPKHGKLVEEQEEFDGSDEAVEMLKWTLQGFPNLKHVRIDSYSKKSDDDAWTEAWGSRRILRDMGWGASGNWADPSWALRNPIATSCTKLLRTGLVEMLRRHWRLARDSICFRVVKRRFTQSSNVVCCIRRLVERRLHRSQPERMGLPLASVL